MILPFCLVKSEYNPYFCDFLGVNPAFFRTFRPLRGTSTAAPGCAAAEAETAPTAPGGGMSNSQS